MKCNFDHFDIQQPSQHGISGQGYAEDYYLDAKSQCAGGQGSCPDKNIPGGKNKVRLLNSAIINDFTMMTYRQVHTHLHTFIYLT